MELTEKNKDEKHLKGWGYELWIANNDKYCGKILHFNKGKRCSFHRHVIKEEHFYLQSGLIKLLVGWDDDITKATEVDLKPGDSYHIPIGLCHQMIALEESDLFEFSSTHYESDSIRIVKGD